MYTLFYVLTIYNLRTFRKSMELFADRLAELEHLLDHHIGPEEAYK
jgi:hypothetical protein